MTDPYEAAYGAALSVAPEDMIYSDLYELTHTIVDAFLAASPDLYRFDADVVYGYLYLIPVGEEPK